MTYIYHIKIYAYDKSGTPYVVHMVIPCPQCSTKEVLGKDMFTTMHGSIDPKSSIPLWWYTYPFQSNFHFRHYMICMQVSDILLRQYSTF